MFSVLMVSRTSMLPVEANRFYVLDSSSSIVQIIFCSSWKLIISDLHPLLNAPCRLVVSEHASTVNTYTGSSNSTSEAFDGLINISLSSSKQFFAFPIFSFSYQFIKSKVHLIDTQLLPVEANNFYSVAPCGSWKFLLSCSLWKLIISTQRFLSSHLSTCK